MMKMPNTLKIIGVQTRAKKFIVRIYLANKNGMTIKVIPFMKEKKEKLK
jgi:hypothetical protein